VKYKNLKGYMPIGAPSRVTVILLGILACGMVPTKNSNDDISR
jgi:hypothetical protein